MTTAELCDTPKLSVDVADVVVVNHNTRHDLQSCLEALAAAHNVGTVWVGDTGSRDGSLEMVHDRFPDVRTHSMPDNPGYGAAANELIARCHTDIVILLNADVRVEHDTIDALRRHLAANPGVALAGPRLVDVHGEPQQSCFDDPTIATLLWRESGLARRWETARGHDRIGRALDGASARSVPWVLGAAVAIRRTAFDAIGGFDPGYFLYYEETDLCRRLRAVGWTIEYVPTAVAVHAGGASTGQQRVEAQRTLYRSLNRYHSIHGGAPALPLRAAVAAIMTARLARDSALSSLTSGDQRARRRAGSTAWRHVLVDAVRGWGVPADPPARHRHDWLILLPAPASPRPTVSAAGAFTDVELRALADHFGIESVAAASPRHPADVVVVRTAGRFDAAEIVDSVAPGGVALVEHTRRLRGGTFTSARAGAALARAGAEVVGRWWLLPHAATARRFVPLDAERPLVWYLDDLLIAGDRPHRVARACVRRLPRSAGWVARAHLTALVNGPARHVELAATAPMLEAGVRPDARLLVMSSGYDAGSRAVVLPFAPGATAPELAVKVSVLPAINATTRREHEHLTELRTSVSRDLAGTMPLPIASFDCGDTQSRCRACSMARRSIACCASAATRHAVSRCCTR